MNRNTISTNFTWVAVTALALGMTSMAKADNKGCSNASLKGTFAYTMTGFITAPAALAGPFAEVGTQTFDGKGGTTATATLSQNGNIIPVTITGTYTVNPDCTGTFTLLVAPFAATVHNYFVISDNGSAFQSIETEAGGVLSRFARKQFPAGDWRE